MNIDLVKKNKQIRNSRPLVPHNVLYQTYENNGVLQICFKSRGCSNYLNGFCIMCDYGVGCNLTPKKLEFAFDSALKESKQKIRVLLLNSYGSILDNNEISEECFNVLLEKVKNANIDNIIFETHYTTITKEKLDLIKNMIPHKNICFELGLETFDEKIRENNLLKYIDNNKFIDKIQLIHSYEMKIFANIIIGIPFFSKNEQIENAVKSINWCFDKMVDEVDLFPMNIRPYTLLKDLYEKGEYEVISHWMLIEVLYKIQKKYLKDIHIAWYGNRDLNYENNMHSIFPTLCNDCRESLFNFYKQYLENNSSDYRKDLINNLIENKKCKCYKKHIM